MTVATSGDAGLAALFGARGPAPAMPFTPTPATARKVQDAFLDRMRRNEPAAWAAMAPVLKAHGYTAEFGRLLAGSPLVADDAGDCMAMYLLLAWLVVHGGVRAVPPGQVIAVRDQARAALAARPGMGEPALRAAFGEEMKLLCVILFGGQDAARRNGTGAAFARGVAAMFADRFGIDLGALMLTDDGLVPR